MPYKDLAKQRACAKRYLERRKVAKYGAAAAGIDMRGRHGNNPFGPEHGAWNPDDPAAPPRPILDVIHIDKSLYAHLPTKEARAKAYNLAYDRAYYQARKAAGWGPNERTRAAGRRHYQRHRQKRLAASQVRRRRELTWTAFVHQLSRQGVTLDQYHALAEAQDFLCRICNEEVPKLTIDHDHQTGRVRGLLCPICNDGLGKFKDQPSRLLAAITYLDSHRQRRLAA